MRGTRLLRRAPLPAGARDHVRLVTRLVMAQAAVVAPVTLPFSRRNMAVIVSTTVLVAALCLLAVVAFTGAQAARTTLLAVETALVVFGLYRFFTYRYVGGTVLGIVVTAVLLHPAVARAYGAGPALAESAEAARADGPVLGGPAPAPVSETAGGALGDSSRR